MIVYLWNRTSRQFSFIIAYLWNRTSRQLSFFIWSSFYLSVCFFQKGICSQNLRMLYIVLLTKSALFLKLLCVWITYGDGAEALSASTITCSPLFSSLLTNKLATEEAFPVQEQRMRLLTNKLATEEGFPVQERRMRLLTNKLATEEGFPVQEQGMRLAHTLLAVD